jgi:hypothetical protein
MSEHIPDLVRAHVLLPRELLEEFDRRVGERQRSARVSELVEEWLRRERAKDVLARFAGSLSREDHPEWRDDAGIDGWVRRLREEGSGERTADRSQTASSQ